MGRIFKRIKAREIKLLGGDGLILKPKTEARSMHGSLHRELGVAWEDAAGHVVIKSLYQDDTNMVGYVDTSSLGASSFGHVMAVHGGCMLGVTVPAPPEGPPPTTGAFPYNP